jgi:protein-S-isoprenylcysteine O-methyltransferase Ste14
MKTYEYIFPVICAYLLIGYFFLGIERRFRQGQEAKTWKTGEHDRGSQTAFSIALGITTVLLMVAPFLDYFKTGEVKHPILIGSIGLIIMIAGLIIRYQAVKILGEFYTRTLRIKSNHEIVDRGMYKVIRHPGYLGVLLLFIGAGIAVVNLIAIIVIPVILISAYIYRIQTKEKMLQQSFDESYREYMKHTWHLVPFIY